jgi:hypothetical protein
MQPGLGNRLKSTEAVGPRRLQRSSLLERGGMKEVIRARLKLFSDGEKRKE